MSRIKNPKEKKRLSLSNDHRTLTLEGNKTFRSKWPLKKARTNRQFRHASTSALEAVEIDTDESPPDATIRPIRTLKKWGVMSLAQSMSVKRTRLRWNYRVLGKNPEALKAAAFLRKPRR
jgi:hypothetical protein